MEHPGGRLEHSGGRGKKVMMHGLQSGSQEGGNAGIDLSLVRKIVA